jgi:hypothetical protein
MRMAASEKLLQGLSIDLFRHQLFPAEDCQLIAIRVTSFATPKYEYDRGRSDIKVA